jgi:hypothetical protein
MITPRSRAIPDGYQSIKIAAVFFSASYLDDGLGRLEFLIKTGKLETFWVDDDLSVKKETSDFWKQQDLNKVLDMFSSGIFDFATLGQPCGFNVRQILVFKQQLAGLLPAQQTPNEEVKIVSHPVSADQVVAQEPLKKNKGGRPAQHTMFAIVACSLLFKGEDHKDAITLLKSAKKAWAKRGNNAVEETSAKRIASDVFNVLVLEEEAAPTSFEILKN